MIEHTPGPWDLEEIPYETNDPEGGWYLHFDNESDPLYISKAFCSEQNAHLIAAAPDLLEALKDEQDAIEIWLHAKGHILKDIFEGMEISWDKINRAIAKAEGRTP